MSEIEYLNLEDLLEIAQAACGSTEVQVRDYGLLEAALARPRASAFGQDAYPDLHVKAAALLHSLVRNHALVDGNKRIAWAAAFIFLDINGHRISDASEDERVDFMVAVASGELESLDKIAEHLRAWSIS
jgi:death on curing protein